MVVDTLGNILIMLAPFTGLTIILLWVKLKRITRAHQAKELVQEVELFLRSRG